MTAKIQILFFIKNQKLRAAAETSHHVLGSSTKLLLLFFVIDNGNTSPIHSPRLAGTSILERRPKIGRRHLLDLVLDTVAAEKKV